MLSFENRFDRLLCSLKNILSYLSVFSNKGLFWLLTISLCFIPLTTYCLIYTGQDQVTFDETLA